MYKLPSAHRLQHPTGQRHRLKVDGDRPEPNALASGFDGKNDTQRNPWLAPSAQPSTVAIFVAGLLSVRFDREAKTDTDPWTVSNQGCRAG